LSHPTPHPNYYLSKYLRFSPPLPFCVEESPRWGIETDQQDNRPSQNNSFRRNQQCRAPSPKRRCPRWSIQETSWRDCSGFAKEGTGSYGICTGSSLKGKEAGYVLFTIQIMRRDPDK